MHVWFFLDNVSIDADNIEMNNINNSWIYLKNVY